MPGTSFLSEVHEGAMDDGSDVFGPGIQPSVCRSGW